MNSTKQSLKKHKLSSYAILGALYLALTLVLIRPGIASNHYQSCRQTKAMVFTGASSKNFDPSKLDAFYEDHQIDFKPLEATDLKWLVEFANSHQNHWSVFVFPNAEDLLGEDLSSQILTQVEIFTGYKMPYALSIGASRGSSLLSLLTSNQIIEKETASITDDRGGEYGGEAKALISSGRSFFQKLFRFGSKTTSTTNPSQVLSKANLAVYAMDFAKNIYMTLKNRSEDRGVSRFLEIIRDTSCKDLSRHPEAIAALESFREVLTPAFEEIKRIESRKIT
jgi:hypothetical protein